MSDVIECPGCSAKLRVPEELRGKKFRCPTCGDMFVPADTPAPATEHFPAPPRPPASSPRQEPEVDADLAPCPSCGKNIPRTSDLCLYCKADLSRGGHDDDEEEEEDYDDRPWERRRRGPRVRRDCEPHRGTLVMVLGILSTVFATMGPCLYGVPALLIGLPLGIVSWVLARRDLAKMKAGTMDPDGYGQTQAGMICGIIGTILSVLVVLGILAVIGIIVLMAMNAH
jgi:predicted RNA-binding Zn-ribbon protein involved in translation (DUF1610 family)